MVAVMAKPRRSAGPKVTFEADYFARTYGRITRNDDVALTELVANAWDAGASKVEITIPTQPGDELTVEDDGCGLTEAEFQQRWMSLAYSRKAHQGEAVEFPPGREGRRRAFGRNGVGRHALFCFGNAYDVVTTKGGKRYSVTIECIKETSDQPFKTVNPKCEKVAANLHGTRLSVRVQRNCPDAVAIRDILGCRFVADPTFQIIVNGIAVEAQAATGFTEQKVVKLDKVTLRLKTYDSGSTGRTMRQSGVAFWVGKRLVGRPSWTVDDQTILDGRNRFARRLVIVAETDDLYDEVEEDWTRFRDGETVKAVYKAVIEYANDIVRKYLSEQVQETTANVVRDNSDQIRTLDPVQRAELSEFVEQVKQVSPALPQDVLDTAVRAFVNLIETRSGRSLIKRLSVLSHEDIEGLDSILNEWSIQDCMAVLDEIGRRIRVVEMIEKLMADPATNELHTLHPLVTEARWLFGPEFESSEFASNISIKNAVSQVLRKKFPDAAFENPRKRADLLILPDRTIAATCTDTPEANGICHIQRILLIELKKGQSAIGLEEMSQAVGYIQDIHGTGLVDGVPPITAFVVGYSVKERTIDRHDLGRSGVVSAATFGGLVRTANIRLFKLRDQVQARFKDISGVSLIDQLLASNPEQQSYLKDPLSANPHSVGSNIVPGSSNVASS